MDFDVVIDTGPLENLLKKLPDATKKKVVRLAVAAGARVIRDKAKELAPYDSTRRTGTHLRDAIVVRRVKNTNDLMNIGVLARKAPHGHLLEFGTVKMSPRPFLRPAADTTKQEVAQTTIKALARGIFREAKKLAK